MLLLKRYQDKLMHFFCGFIITLGVASMVGVVTALVIGTLAGVAKETYDQYDYNGGDFFDFFATVAGSVVGIFAYGIIGLLL